MMVRSWRVQLLLWILLLVAADLSSSQSMNPQNIEVFYPFPVPDSPTPPPDFPAPLPDSPAPPPDSLAPPSSRSDVSKAVAATAASTLVFAAIFFFALQRYCLYRRVTQRRVAEPNPYSDPPMALPRRFSRVDRNIKGLIVDENGLDVLYWRKLEERGFQKTGFADDLLHKKQFHPANDRSKRPEQIQEVPLLRDKSSASYDMDTVRPQIEIEIQDKHAVAPPEITELKAVGKRVSPPIPPVREIPAPPPPTPPVRKIPAPPPPLPPASGNKKGPTPPPLPPPKANGSSWKPPPNPKKEAEEQVNGQVKLKPLHWEKVNANTEHSMVWNKLDKGSFRFDGDLMEALFGTVATNRSSPQNKPGSAAPSPSTQITILDPRKSQNIAIVLKSLQISRQTLISSLQEGHGLETETIEKLTRITPTKEEESKILSFAGDPTRLADAESFLHQLLKAVPSAFARLELMHFRWVYGSEMEQLRDWLQTLESGCNELRTRGLFMKLLEAILKAGNRMNAGTARGNAQAFNLTALRKLSDVKSTDGKTTLLHFVVQEVVRAEGKRGTINRNRSMSRNTSLNSSDRSKEEREKQYTILGLPVVGGLSAEFGNVKKSAGIDYDTFAGAWSNLSARVSESQRALDEAVGGSGGFVGEMKRFLEMAEEEVKVVGGEQRRVMEMVKSTTEYYQAGASKDRGAAPLQLFVIVKDFLNMVDQVCIQIARNSQQKKAVNANSNNVPPPAKRSSAKFPILPKHFMSDKSSTSSSESDSD